MDRGTRNLASAVINQALVDLDATCVKVRGSAVEFLTDSSPWSDMIELDAKQICTKLCPKFIEALKLEKCIATKKRKTDRVCPICGVRSDL